VQVQYPKGDHTFEQYQEWAENKREESRRFYGSGASLQNFFEDSISTFLSDCGSETVVYSPLNVYMALAMLAECGAGNTRQQILDLFNVESIEALRTQVHGVWNANYSDDGLVTSLLANSVWMNKNVSYREDAIQNLVKYHFASTYQGEMGSNGYNQALRQWLNDQTGGLLKDQIDHIELPPDTVLALYSTIFFEAAFEEEFSAEKTTQKIFHSAVGLTKCDYLVGSESTAYYWGKKFTAVSKSLQRDGDIIFILPDQGVSVQALLKNEEALSLIANTEYSWKNTRNVIVNFEIPKFKVSSNLDLAEKLKALGVTDCFDAGTADFSPLSGKNGIYVSSVRHGATVTIEESGVLGAAYTEILKDYLGAPSYEEVDFILKRPFIFVIRGADRLPLFVGVVNQI
jgi:serine protease inhibitor